MRRLFAMAAAAALLVLTLAPGAMAKDPLPDPQVPLTGVFVNTFVDGDVNEIDAGTPFFVENGWCGFDGERTSLLNPATRASISLDGTPLVMGTIVDLHFVPPEAPECLYGKFNYHNFRFGLPAGTYTFVATFTWLGESVVDPATTTLIVH